METFFPKCRPLFWRKRHEQRHQQKHETTRRRTTRVIIIIITLLLPLGRSFFWYTLLLCAVRLFFSKAAFVLHQRATTTPSSGIFSLACRPFGGHWTNDTKLNNTQLILFSEERHKRLSLSLSVCVFLLEQQQVEVVFLSASKSSSVLRRSSFVVKGKERFKNETNLESRVQTRMWMRRRSLDWVETEIRTWHQRQRQTSEWDDVFRSKTDGTRRDLFTSLC